jgi:hypothetical protein
MRLITQVLDDGQVLILGINVQQREVFRFYMDRTQSFLNNLETDTDTKNESFLESGITSSQKDG